MDEGGDDISEAIKEARERSLEDDLRDLAGNARTYALAELAFQKSRAAYVGKAAGWIAGLVAVALVFLFFAVMATVLGAILTLTPFLTALGATAAVVAVLLVCAVIAGVVAMRKWRTMIAVFEGKEP